MLDMTQWVDWAVKPEHKLTSKDTHMFLWNIYVDYLLSRVELHQLHKNSQLVNLKLCNMHPPASNIYICMHHLISHEALNGMYRYTNQ